MFPRRTRSLEEEMIHDRLAARLAQRRYALGLTQKEASRLLGLSLSIISDIEKRRRLIAVHDLVLFCRGYKASADELLGLKGEEVGDGGGIQEAG